MWEGSCGIVGYDALKLTCGRNYYGDGEVFSLLQGRGGWMGLVVEGN